MRFLCIILLSLIFLSCKHNQPKKHETLVCKPSYFQLKWLPDPIEDIASHSHPFRFVVTVNLNCESCLSEFMLWEELTNHVTLNNTYLRFIVTGNNDPFRNYIMESEVIGSLWFYDNHNSFYTKNNIENNQYRTFVLDSQNHIIFRGSLLVEGDYLRIKEYAVTN